MSDFSAIPAVERKVRTLLTAAAELNGVKILVSEGDPSAAEQVVIEGSSSKPQFRGLGSRVPMREDPIRITCSAQTLKQGKPDYLDLKDRACEIVGVVTKLLRDNPHLDNTWLFGRVTDLEIKSGVVDKGRGATVTFVIEGKADHS